MKNKIIIVRSLGEKELIKVAEKSFKDTDEFIQYKEHQIPKPPKNPYTFTTNKLNLIFFDLDKKEYIKFDKRPLGLSTEFLDSLFNRKIIEQLARAIKKGVEDEKPSWDFVKTLIIGGVCALGGYLIGTGGFG